LEKENEKMKKIMVVLVSVLVALSLSMAAVAQEVQKVRGTVTKIDAAAKSVTIKTCDGTAVTVVMENADLLSKVKEGEKGEARYVVKDGKNACIKLRKLVEGC
jgi:Cu/Ag efflux protein CusF